MKNFWPGNRLRKKVLPDRCALFGWPKAEIFGKSKNQTHCGLQAGLALFLSRKQLAGYATKWLSLMAIFVHGNRISRDYAVVEINILLSSFFKQF